jgi:hypothetical protein
VGSGLKRAYIITQLPLSFAFDRLERSGRGGLRKPIYRIAGTPATSDAAAAIRLKRMIIPSRRGVEESAAADHETLLLVGLLTFLGYGQRQLQQ